MKSYVNNLRDKIDQRNEISADYHKHKFNLDERKFKKITQERTEWNIDNELVEQSGIEPERVKADPKIAKCFLYGEVSL